jgi:glycosyltransferase involved in cell wall biosynthesis
MAIELEALSNRKVHVITNGFSADDFKYFKSIPSEKIIFFHHGSLNSDRNPIKLWQYLGRKISDDSYWYENLEIHLIGAVDISVIQSINEYGLNNHLIRKDFMAHSEVILELAYSSICLLPLNNSPNAKGIMPNKLYEYLATGKPIVVIGPKDGDTCQAIKHLKNVCFFEFNEVISDTAILNVLKVGEIKSDISKFSRESLSEQLDHLLNSM